MKLIVEVEIQTYGEDDQAQGEMLVQIAKTITDVVSLCDLAVGTFVKTEVKE